MSETIVAKKKSGKSTGQNIPDYLIYEVSQGKPLYYKGYKEVLNKTKTFEEITMESKLQAGLKAVITAVLYAALKKLGYQLAVGELGVNISKEDKRGADLAIFRAEQWDWEPTFSDLPPEVVIEIDVQAELEDLTETDYISTKIKDYLAFGVKKVIWIFTKGKTVYIATPQLPWLIYDWSVDIEVVEGVHFRLDDLVNAA